QRGGRCRFVEMHRLRVELGSEGDDFLARYQARTVDGNRALLEIFPMAFRHSPFCNPPRPGLSRMTAIQTPQRPKSGRKPEMHHVTVGNHVVLALEPHL